jgi:hypothetical protein
MIDERDASNKSLDARENEVSAQGEEQSAKINRVRNLK